MRKVFVTKAQTLNRLSLEKTIFKIPNSIYFSIYEWNKRKSQIIKNIKTKLSNNLAIRSSAIDEDTNKTSSAGAYNSFLDISNNEYEIKKYVKSVIYSYKKKNNNSLNNEILIQDMVPNVWTSGVLFTKSITNNSPYYVINYDDSSGKTDKVTSGADHYSNKVLKILRNKEKLLISPRFNKLIKATKETEKIFKNKNLDIEFVIDKNLNIFLLQVRPLTKVKKFLFKKEFYLKVNQTNKKVRKNISNHKNIINIFGQMPDWNPAEMIGKYPKDLSFSLYSELITKKSWYVARKLMGYSNFKDNQLMKNFAGQPFIDVKKSFLSLLPEKLPDKLKNKMLDQSLNILKNNPELHDKIEFECCVNCQTLDTMDLVNKVYKNLSKNEKRKVIYELSNLTKKNLDFNKNSLFNLSINQIKKLQKEQIEFSKYNIKDLKKILNLTKKNGIIPFSILARHAFISQSILKSLVEKKILNKKNELHVLSSVKTITTELVKDSYKLSKGIIKFNEFKDKYGHLRPGTYNLESRNYRSMNIKNFTKSKNLFKSKLIEDFKINKQMLNKFNLLAKKQKFPILNLENLIKYIKLSIYWREFSKFVFTKSIDQVLNIIKKFAKDNKIKINDLAYIEIEYLLRFKKSKISQSEIKDLKKKILYNQNNFKINNLIELPLLIKSNTDAFIIPSQISRANFVTDKRITGETFYIKDNKKKLNNNKLKNKIILIDGADPGYDWIFLHGIKGLITKFGGANSHMSIRCFELGIPAAIGCGNEKFNDLKKLSSIEIDTISKSIKGNL